MEVICYKGTTVPRNAAIFKSTGGNLDVARVEEGYFASTAWLKSDEAFDSVSGESFGWTDVFDTDELYKNRKYAFSPMSQEQWDSLTSKQKDIFLFAYKDEEEPEVSYE